ncbi:MAG TPA: hypothetical protein VGF48_03060 [Thermoanaerobaculia bacterium]|jgi:hypothetical protein
MKRLLQMVLLLTISATALSAEIHGAWTLTRGEKDPSKFYLNMTRGGWSHNGNTVKLTSFQGLTDAQVNAPTQTPAQFRIVSDAGTITFDGTFRNGDGAGQFTFAPNGNFFTQVRNAGVKVNRREGRSEEDELYSLAMMHISLAYVREMHGIFPEADLRELSKLRAVDVTSQWLADMRAAGVTISTSRDAIKLAAVGVNAAYVRELAAAGYKDLTARQLIKLRATGVDAKFIREMSKGK